MSIWQDSSGKILLASGSVLECEECPCGGCSCPCASWPADPTSADFPCGGLEYQYVIGTAAQVLTETTYEKKQPVYDLTTASLVSSLSFTSPVTIQFKPDGTRLFVSSNSGTTPPVRLTQYDLSTAWDVSTASAAGTWDFDGRVEGFSFNSTGTKVYFNYATGGDFLYSATLSTAWDITSAGTPSSEFSLRYDGGADVICKGHAWKTDDSRVFVVEDANDYVLEFTSGGTYVQRFGLPAGTKNYVDIKFSSDGRFMSVIDGQFGSPGTMYKYELCTPWDLSTAALVESQSTAYAWHYVDSVGGMLYAALSNSIAQYSVSVSATVPPCGANGCNGELATCYSQMYLGVTASAIGTECMWEYYAGDVAWIRREGCAWFLDFYPANYCYAWVTYQKVGGTTPVGVYTLVGPIGCKQAYDGYFYEYDAPATVEVTDAP